MLSTYKSYTGSKCRKEFALLADDVEGMKGYLVCPFYNSQRISKHKITDNLKECTGHRKYKQDDRAIKQKL